MPRSQPCRRTLFALLAFAVGAVPLASCVKNAATGHSQLNLMSRQEEIDAGKSAMPELIQSYGGIVPDAALQTYVTRVGMDLVQYTEADYKSLPWEFTFLNSDVINAFALPGGKVFITRGLAERMTNEAQLAGVLGHEIGHVTAEHADKRMAEQLGVSIGAAVGSAVISAAAGEKNQTVAQVGSEVFVTGLGVYALTFSRTEENEADALGMRYMTKAGYNPMAQYQVMEILRSAAGSGGSPEFLSTHPAPQTRMDRIKKQVETTYASTQNNPQYQFYEARFQTGFLDLLKKLPPPPAPPKQQ